MTINKMAGGRLITAALRIQPELTEKDIPVQATRAPGVSTEGGMAIGVLTDAGPFNYTVQYEGQLYHRVRLTMGPSAGDLTRLSNGVAAVLVHHDARLQVGTIMAAWYEGDQMRIAVAFSTREEAQAVRKDVQAGILKGLSLGMYYYDRDAKVDHRPSDRGPGQLHIRKWHLVEATLTPIPANERAVVLQAEAQRLGPVDAPAAIAAVVQGHLDGEIDERRQGQLQAAARRGLAPIRVGSSRLGTWVTVPERLLTAAVTTTTTGAGLIQDHTPIDDIWSRVAGPARLMTYLPRKTSPPGKLGIPKVTAGPVPAVAAEGAASVTLANQVAYTITSLATQPRRITVPFRADVATAFSANFMDAFEAVLRSIVDSDFVPIMAEKMNEELWVGDGTGNRISGLANRVPAGNTATYAAATTGQQMVDALYQMVQDADDADAPQERVFMLSSKMYKKLFVTEREVLHDVASYDADGMPMLWGIRAVKDVDIPEASGTNFGRAWLVMLPWLKVVGYGMDADMDGAADLELVFRRERQTAAYALTIVKLWDLVSYGDEALQLLKEA